MTIQITSSQVADRETEKSPGPDRLKLIASAELKMLSNVMEASVHSQTAKVHTGNEVVATGSCFGEAEISNLVKAVLRPDGKSAEAILQQNLDAGVSDEVICLELLAPAAARLGGNWQADEVNFYQVTTGIAQLQSLLRVLDGSHFYGTTGGGCGNRVVFCGAPGDQHLFGLSMLEFFFRRDGWDTISTIGMPPDEALNIANDSPCDLVAFSCSCSGLLDDLTSVIQLTRSESIKHDTKLMVGGQLFSSNPDLVNAVGADAGACDATEAVRIARSLVDA